MAGCSGFCFEPGAWWRYVFTAGAPEGGGGELRFTLSPNFGFLFFVEGATCHHYFLLGRATLPAPPMLGVDATVWDIGMENNGGQKIGVGKEQIKIGNIGVFRVCLVLRRLP